jgi:hypothetical protein
VLQEKEKEVVGWERCIFSSFFLCCIVGEKVVVSLNERERIC